MKHIPYRQNPTVIDISKKVLTMSLYVCIITLYDRIMRREEDFYEAKRRLFRISGRIRETYFHDTVLRR